MGDSDSLWSPIESNKGRERYRIRDFADRSQTELGTESNRCWIKGRRRGRKVVGMIVIAAITGHGDVIVGVNLHDGVAKIGGRFHGFPARIERSSSVAGDDLV